MGDIKFTKLERPPKIMRRFGELTITATKSAMRIDGFFKISPKATGDKEVVELAKELLGAWYDDRKALGAGDAIDGTRNTVHRARIKHPRLGEVAGYRSTPDADALKFKVTDQGTEFEFRGLHIVSDEHLQEIRHALVDVLKDRTEIRGDTGPAGDHEAPGADSVPGAGP